MKCKYCNKTNDLEVLGVSGRYNKNWRYCEEHHDEAYKERDVFLKEKIGKTYGEVVTPPLYQNEKLDDLGT